MNAEIIAVGTELLLGQIANTNAQYISRRLPEVGVNVYYHSVVGDNVERLKNCLHIAMERSDVIILTGGLGPTEDDLTKETVSEMLGKKLVLHNESYESIRAFFEKYGRTMTDNNLKQAYLPEGCSIIRNKNGTAPGCIVKYRNVIFIMLPGPPSEMAPMFEESVLPYFIKEADHSLESKYIRIFGLGESQVENLILDLVENQTNPTIALYAKPGEVMIRITASCSKGEPPGNLINPIVDEIRERLGDRVYSVDDEELEEVVAKLLVSHGLTISIAESCTGGLVSKKLTDVPGISEVFEGSVVAYSNNLKNLLLKVSKETLERCGAVSKKTAVEMAEGIRKISGTDIGLAITGLAGPDGGTLEKPVGLVYVAISYEKGSDVKELRLWGERNRIRNTTALHALDLVRKYIMAIS